MSWLVSILIAVVAGGLSAVAAGFVANLYTDWYHVSTREGGAGYFVIFIALAGLIAGFVLGLIVARVVAGGAHPGALKTLVVLTLSITVIAATTASTFRLLADIPPTLRGETLILLAEVRWPLTQDASPALDPVGRALVLAALSGRTERARKAGPFWTEDAQRVDGRWVVPGAVEVFTSRGTRVLSIDPTLPGAMGLRIPLGARPTDRDHVWTEWMPHAREGMPSLPDGFSYRYRVVRRSEPSHIEQVGPFEVRTVADGFWVGAYENGKAVFASRGNFSVWHRGTPVSVAGTEVMTSVATLPGTPNALLVAVAPNNRPESCHLITFDGDVVRTTEIGRCQPSLTADLITDNQEWRDDAKMAKQVSGRIDRTGFMRAASYLLDDALFDVTTRTSRPMPRMQYPQGFHAGVPPLGVSPDLRSIVRLGFSETERGEPALLVFTNDSAGTAGTYLVPFGRAAVRYPGDDGITLEWFGHYFSWTRDASGLARLTLRDGVKPLPYRGTVVVSDDLASYQVYPSGEAMVAAMTELLAKEFHPKRSAEDIARGGFHATIDDVPVSVFYNENGHYASVYSERGQSPKLIHRIAARFNTILADGTYDHLFVYAPHDSSAIPKVDGVE